MYQPRTSGIAGDGEADEAAWRGIGGEEDLAQFGGAEVGVEGGGRVERGEFRPGGGGREVGGGLEREGDGRIGGEFLGNAVAGDEAAGRVDEQGERGEVGVGGERRGGEGVLEEVGASVGVGVGLGAPAGGFEGGVGELGGAEVAVLPGGEGGLLDRDGERGGGGAAGGIGGAERECGRALRGRGGEIEARAGDGGGGDEGGVGVGDDGEGEGQAGVAVLEVAEDGGEIDGESGRRSGIIDTDGFGRGGGDGGGVGAGGGAGDEGVGAERLCGEAGAAEGAGVGETLPGVTDGDGGRGRRPGWRGVSGLSLRFSARWRGGKPCRRPQG